MAIYKKAKKYVRGVAKRGMAMAKKRYVKKGQPNLTNIIKDVTLLKHLVNIEKKRIDVTLSSAIPIAQSSGVGVSGQYAITLSPNVGQGTQQGQRIGNSIKLVSGFLAMQFSQQASCINDLKFKWYLVVKPDNASLQTAPTSCNQFFEPNPFSGVNDYYSSRDPEYFNSMRIIRTGIVNLKQDQITSGTSIVQVRVPIKCDLHQKYDTNATTLTTKNTVTLFVVASGGDTVALTGGSLVYNMRWYYTDN